MFRLGGKSVKYILFLIVTLLTVTNSAFALEQLKNYDFTSALANDNWQTNRRISGSNNSTVDIQNNNLRIYGNHNGNIFSGTRNYDGMAYQTFRTPATAINVRFDWGEWSATGGNSNRNFWIGYSTSNQQNANVDGGEYLSQQNAVGNYTAGTKTVTNLNTNTTFYAKLYGYATLNRGYNITVLFDSLAVNFSPSGLAGEVTPNGVSLSWNTSTSNAVTLSKYYIYRSTTSGSGYTKIAEVNAGTTTYVDTTVSGGTYYYVITDIDTSSVESPYSKEISCYVPKAPSNLSGSLNGSNNAVLTWSAPSPANTGHNGYAILRGNSESGPFTRIGTVSGNTLTYTDTSITISNGDSYFYVVADINSSLNYISGYSNVANVGKLDPPTDLTAVQNNGIITLTWTASTCPPAKLGGYYIYRSNASGGPYTRIGTVGNVLTYNDTTATEGVTWYYVVSVRNNSGAESDYSNEANSMIPTLSLTVSIDSSVAPEIVRPQGSNAEIPVNWVVNTIGSGLNITGYTVTIYKSNGTAVRSGSTSDSSATSYTVSNVPLENGQSYYATVAVFYTIGSAAKSREFISNNSFTAITPKTISVVDGWSGKDIAYSFFDNRVEACWELDKESPVVRYEVAVGTTQYGTDLVDWQDIGLVNRISLTTPELASGTTYYTSVRGITQKKNQAVMGCSNGFIARKDPVNKDTDALNFFNNARVLENLSTDDGKLTPAGDIANGNWKYYMPVTITEPGVTDRVNAPCLVNFTIPNGKRPTNVREFRVVDDQGNAVPRYNLTTPNNSTVDHPYIVFLVNMQQGETRTYYIYWGDNTAAEQAHGFVNYTDENSLNAWTPYYSRKDMPAGLEEVVYNNKIADGDDDTRTLTLTPDISRFYIYGTNKTNGWYISTNGFICEQNVSNQRYTTYCNRFYNFTGQGRNENPATVILKKCICPLWVDHQTGTDWSESGLFRNSASNPNRIIFTWITYRFGVIDDAYKFQAVLYETGDIALRYGLINPRALISDGKYDRAVNTSEHHTVGISNGDNTHYLYNTPLQVGINQNPTAFYQCMNAFDNTTAYGSIAGNGTEYKVAHFESMVFDTRIASPKWTSLQYDTTITGTRKIELAYRTGNTPLPDNSWTAWSAVTTVNSSVTNGEIAITTNGRYIQYKADFIKSANAGTMSLNEVRFVYGGISIQDVSSVVDGQPVTEVTQGQTNVPLTVTIRNESPAALSLNVATLTFTLNGHSATLTDPSLPFSIPAGELTTLTYSVNIADNATTGECTIDALATVSALIYDDGAQNPFTWTVKSKSSLVIDNVYSEYTKVTKGYTYNLFVTLTNTGETDCMLNSIWPTYASGTYSFIFDSSYGLATGTYPGGGENTIIHGNETKTAKFLVEISSESNSGSDTLGAVASATNILSGEIIEILTTDNPHIWTIQTPAELNLFDIVASSTIYRGQKNNNIILMATNEGEAELEWYPGSSTQHIAFTPVTGPAKGYENKKMVTEEPVINITSNNIVQAKYTIDVRQDTATGTDRITTELFGKEINTGVSLGYAESIPFAEWTIYSERVNTYADGAYSEEKDSFNRPSGAETVTVYAKVENLAPNVEYVVHWIAPDGTEIEKTNPTITAGQGYFGCWLTFNSSSQSGLHIIRITDPLDVYTCCENTFEIVAPAEMDASFTLPLYATINQPIAASFTFINLGGAVITNATLVPTDTVDISGMDRSHIVFTPDDTEALFSPRLSDVPGYGQTTTTFKLSANQVGTFKLIASATGFDNNSGLVVSKGSVQSNICTIQNPPDIRITNITKTSNTVFKNQKNLRVTATIQNNGEATAVVTAASITFNIGSYEQELMGYPEGLELELAAGQLGTITFDVSVNADSDSGNDTLTINAIWYDKNWPRDMISSANTTWTIAECGIMLSPDPDFDYEQADYMRGQTINVRAYGFGPGSKYYRIRFYDSQINQANQVPAGYLEGDQAYSGLLQASDNGYVDHIYILSNTAKIGTWSVTVEYCGEDINTEYTTRGTMQALQYFRVQNTPHMTAVITAENVSIENNDKIFVGDTFKVRMTITSTSGDNVTTPAVNTGAIDFIEPYSLIKNPGATGNVELVSGPDPATFTLRAGESKTFEYVYRAVDDTTGGRFRFKSSDNANVARGRNRNIWDHNDDTAYDVFAKQDLLSNEIDIYRKSMRVEPESIDYGFVNVYTEDYPQEGLVDGASEEFVINLVKTGNYDVENILLNGAALNGLIGDNGIRKSISSAYFTVDVASLSNPLTRNSESTKALLNIPYNQPEGPYTSTMFLYSDSNNNRVFDSGEVTAEFNVYVYVNRAKVILINDKVIDAGSWSRGKTTDYFEVNYFNAGNVDCSKAKIVLAEDNIASPLTDYIHFTTPSDGNIGAIPVGEFQKAVFNISIDNNAPLGTYIATYTIFEDRNEDGKCKTTISPHNPEPFDTFQVRLTIGEPNFTVLPAKITASPVETSLTARSGIYPSNFAHLIINNSNNGMPLSRIKMIADNFDGVDKLGNHYPMASNTVDVYPGTLKQPLEKGESDEFDIEVYIAPGTRCATYTTHLHFYSDDNDNNIIDPDEFSTVVELEVYVKPTEKVKVIDKPVSVTGMSSDIQDTFAECEFLCYNLGNVDLKHLNFEMQNLVQKDVPTPVTIDKSKITMSFVGNDPFVAPLNSEFSSKINIRVPQGTPDGVYVTTALCKLYNDNGGDPEYDESNPPAPSGYKDGKHNEGVECVDSFQVWLQIGEMKIAIVNPHDVHGEPTERSSDGVFTVKNDGALTVTSVIATATDFIMGPNVIPATASVFLSSPKVGTLKAGFQRNVTWVVDIPECMPAGVYTGKICAWSDTDSNEQIGVAEASATADVKIIVESTPKLSIRSNSLYPTDLNEIKTPFIMNNSTVNYCFRIYNTGNEDIEVPIQVDKNNLTFMTNAITTEDFGFTIDSALPIHPGEYRLATVTVTLGDTHLVNGNYRGEQTFYVKVGENVLCSDKAILDVEFGKKELQVDPNPLVIDLSTETEGTVHLTRIPPAGVTKVYAYEKSHCDRNETYCDETTITCIPPSPMPVNMGTGSGLTTKDFRFEVNLGSHTAPGTHIATWTFFDDGDGDGLYDEGEYYVDFQIHYIVPAKYDAVIEPAHIEVVDVAPGETVKILYTVRNTGNQPLDLTKAHWSYPIGITIFNENGTPFYLNDSSSGFGIIYEPTGLLDIESTDQYIISLTAPNDQELGSYSPSISHTFYYDGVPLANSTIGTILVLRRGPVTPTDTVYQVLATDTFIDVTNAESKTYFISAWICPGLPDPANLSAANLSVIRVDKEGKPKAALSVRMSNNGLGLENNLETADYKVYKDNPDYENVGPSPATFSFSLKPDGKPICGISGDPITAIDEADPSKRLTFYRVYFAFNVGESIATDSSDISIEPENQDKIVILLTQSNHPDNTASTTVYFDGVKLEKMLFDQQDRPTTYHKSTTLVSPSTILDVSGKHKHYEW